MNDTTTTESPSDVHSLVRSGAEGACMEACKQPCGNERRANRSTAPINRGDALTDKQFAEAVDELCAASRAYNGRGSEYLAKRAVVLAAYRAAVVALLDQAGVVKC